LITLIVSLHNCFTHGPLQGQGASQSIEDAEALSTFFSTTTSKSTLPDITRALSNIFEARYRRSSLIQAYSRQQAQLATETGDIKVTLNAAAFLDYNCKDEAAMKWLEEQRRSTSQAASSSQLRTAIDYG
jgi:salicylate hydroxylase